MKSVKPCWLHVNFVLIVISGTTLISGCASIHQKEHEVYWRRSAGQLEFWKPLPEAASIHWPYAWAALAAYQDSDDPKRKKLTVSETCPGPHALLTGRQWIQWPQIPTLIQRKDELYAAEAKRMRENHLRVRVWSNAQTKQVVVALEAPL